jgi:uncharacterized protein YbjT (DUF2867 family)
MIGTTLVTGSTGTVGTFLVKKLVQAGVHVKAAVHTLEKGKDLEGPNVEIVPFDTRKNETLGAAFFGVQNLFILTPFSKDQVEAEKLLTALARAAKVKHIVKLSASGADLNSTTSMGKSHGESEKFVEASGVPYTFLRPNSFMQNFVTFYGGDIKKEGKIHLPLGSGKVSYVDARDVASAAAAVFLGSGHEGKIYRLTGPEAIAVAQVAELFSAAIGKKVEYVDEKEETMRQRMEEVGMPAWMVSAMLELHAANKAGKNADVTRDIENLTGKKATPFEQFAKDYAGLFA